MVRASLAQRLEECDMDMAIELHCDACGSASYSLSEAAEDGSSIRCNDCGAAQGTVAELKAALTAQIVDQSAESLRRGIGGLDGQPA